MRFVTLADLFMPLLREPSKLIFHWGNIILAFLLGLTPRPGIGSLTDLIGSCGPGAHAPRDKHRRSASVHSFSGH